MRIVVNGAGVAGPTLAWWLRKSGHEVLLVEQSPELRSGGYAIDFWGVGYDIAEKMGLLPRIGELGFKMKEVRYVDRQGRKCGGFSVDVFDRLTNGHSSRCDAPIWRRRSTVRWTTRLRPCLATPSPGSRSRQTACRSSSIMPPRAKSIWSSARTACIRESVGWRSGTKLRSKSRSAITSPRSKLRGIGRATSLSPSVTPFREGRCFACRCPTIRRCFCSCFATST